jgi:homeobox-leucine zipper protein
VVHAEYDETSVHQLYRQLLRSGQALGARRWLASLQRQCQYLAILCSNSLPARDHAGEQLNLLLITDQYFVSFYFAVRT